MSTGCTQRVVACTGGHLVVTASFDIWCDAGPRDAGPPDTGPAPFDAGGVHTCDEATAMVGSDPCDGGFRCGGGACDGFASCWQCPLLLACESGQLTVTMTLSADSCDAGAAPVDAGADAP